MKKLLLAFTILSFFVTSVFGTYPVYAEEFVLPKPGVMVHLSPEFNPPILKGIKVHPDNPFRFDFILDQGDNFRHSERSEESKGVLKTEATRLIKYFLASLTIPEKDLWVNLSPYEKDRIIPKSFGLTEMGRDLLAEDYMLKQITASLIYPEDDIGKKFWKRIYEEAAKKFGTTNIPVNTFNKVWIVPEKAVVYENAKAGTAYVVEAKLKVMLEQDYLAMSKREVNSEWLMVNGQKQNTTTINNSPLTINQLGSQIVREIIIPELTKEVNEGKNFTQLRQVYNSLILATWYKKKIKDSILAQVYNDKNKIRGTEYTQSILTQRQPGDMFKSELQRTCPQAGCQASKALNVKAPQGNNLNDVEVIYQRYLAAFKKGAYNYIKEEIDPLTQESIPRKYFSGGVDWAMFGDETGKTLQFTTDEAMVHSPSNGTFVVDMNARPLDAAMTIYGVDPPDIEEMLYKDPTILAEYFGNARDKDELEKAGSVISEKSIRYLQNSPDEKKQSRYRRLLDFFNSEKNAIYPDSNYVPFTQEIIHEALMSIYLKIRDFRYGDAAMLGDRAQLTVTKMKSGAVIRLDQADPLVHQLYRAWDQKLEESQRYWQNDPRFPIPYNASVSPAYDPFFLERKSVGAFLWHLEAPPESNTAVSREDLKKGKPFRTLLHEIPDQILMPDFVDPNLVIIPNRWPKAPYASLLITRLWQPQFLTQEVLDAQFRWAKLGSILEFHRVGSFVNHLHIHLYAPQTVPIGRFASKFEELVGDKNIEIGELQGYPAPHIALTSHDDNSLKKATLFFLNFMERDEKWFYEVVLKNPKNNQVLVLFFPVEKNIRLGLSVSGLVRSKDFNLTKQEVLSEIRERFISAEALNKLRSEFWRQWMAFGEIGDNAQLAKGSDLGMLFKAPNNLQSGGPILLPGGADVLTRGRFRLPRFWTFMVQENERGELIVSSRGGGWATEGTTFRISNIIFNMMHRIEELDRDRTDKNQPIVIVDWGCGTGLALRGLLRSLHEREREGQGIPNVILYGFANEYYPEWRQAGKGIHFILDIADHLKDHLAQYKHHVQIVYSVNGLEHLFADKNLFIRHLKDLRDLLDIDNGRLLVADMQPSWVLSAGLTAGDIFSITPIEGMFSLQNEIIHPTEWKPIKNRDGAQLTDRAMKIQEKGGIDLTPANMHVETKTGSPAETFGDDNGRSGNDSGIKFHIDPAQLVELQNAPGFVPVIIDVEPLKDLKSFLGVTVQ